MGRLTWRRLLVSGNTVGLALPEVNTIAEARSLAERGWRLSKSELKQLVGLLECSDSTHEYYGIANEIFAREERDINLEALKRYGKNLLDRLQT